MEPKQKDTCEKMNKFKQEDLDFISYDFSYVFYFVCGKINGHSYRHPFKIGVR